MTPWRLDLTVQRWTPFVFRIQFPAGVDLSAAVLRAQVRLYPDQPGRPLIDLKPGSPIVQGLSLSTVADAAGIVTSTVQIRIDEATIEVMPGAAEIGGPGAFVWDLHITLPEIGKRCWVTGNFEVQPGVTQ